jgi:DNA replication protein DnaC
MLTHPTSERLRALGLVAMAQALEEQRRQPDLDGLGFEERLALLVEHEATGREDRRMRARLKFAGLRQSACIEDIDWRAARGLDRAMFQRLASGDWIDRHQGVLLTGPTGVGKTWLACALGHKACRDGRSVLYQRLPRLLEALALAKGDGRYARMLKGLARVQVLLLDDWGLTPLTAEGRRDLLEVIDDRHGRAATVVTSQLPVPSWHEWIADPTLGDAILDRLVHNAHRIELKGESMRRRAARRAVAVDAEGES